MPLTIHGHSCVAFSASDTLVVVDPGVIAPHPDLTGASAILLTHSHGDHVDVAAVSAAMEVNPGLVVVGPESALEELRAAGAPADRLRKVSGGEKFSFGSIEVDALALMHNEIHPDLPSPENVGYLIDSRVLHPGDSLAEVDVAVDTLLLPIAGPWLDLGAAITFARRISARRVIPIHDAVLSEVGRAINDGMLSAVLADSYLRVASGKSVDLPDPAHAVAG